MSIKINTIEPVKVEVFTPTGESLGFANSDEMTDLQLQICEADISGYTYVFTDKDDVKHEGTIDNNGQLSNWYPHMFDHTQRLYVRLIQSRREKMNK